MPASISIPRQGSTLLTFAKPVARMRRTVRTTLNYLFSIFLTVVFLYFAFRGTDFHELGQVLSRANYWWAFAMLPPLLLSHVFRAWRWKYLLRPIKKETRFRNLFSAMSIGYLINNLLPKVGELVRPYAIGKLEGLSRSSAFGTLLVERIFDILSFLVLVGLIPLVYSGPLTQYFPWLEETGIWITAITLLALAVIVFLMMRRDIVERLLTFVTRHLSPRRAELVQHIAHAFLDGFLFLKEPKHYLAIGTLSVLVWGLYVVMMYLPFYAFGLVETYGLDLNSAIVLQAISSIGYMAPTPGATGPYHYFTIQTLTKLYGVDSELARSYAVVTHALGFMATTIIGLYFMFRDKLHLADVLKQSPRPGGEAPADGDNATTGTSAS
jgi:uncharacterized protein (TIRG00374 family)